MKKSCDSWFNNEFLQSWWNDRRSADWWLYTFPTEYFPLVWTNQSRAEQASHYLSPFVTRLVVLAWVSLLHLRCPWLSVGQWALGLSSCSALLSPPSARWGRSGWDCGAGRWGASLWAEHGTWAPACSAPLHRHASSRGQPSAARAATEPRSNSHPSLKWFPATFNWRKLSSRCMALASML